MKCPKCGYLAFEPVERCRNCGYDLSLVPSHDLPELPLNVERKTTKPFADLQLADESQDPAAAASAVSDLPLFDPPADVPLPARPSRPRAPLAVRRPTPDSARLRERGGVALLDPPAVEEDSDTSPSLTTVTPGPAAGAGSPPAGLGARGKAALIDLTLLALIDVIVVYFTLRICGLTAADFSLVPMGPLGAFLVLQNGGYLTTFNASGQTLGKMLVGIRVVPAEGDSPLTATRSMVRTAVWMVLAAPLGLGFLSVLTKADRRGFHDRCAGTRVVRTSPA